MLNSLEAYNAQSFSFNFTTSSGDNISLDLAREQSLSYENSGDQEVFTFEQTRSLNLKIEGNGLDANDMAEIEKALELAAPELDAFINPQDELSKTLNETANKIRSLLPEPQNSDALAFIKQGLVQKADDLTPKLPLEEAKEDPSIKRASDLLDTLFYQLNNLGDRPLYA